MAAQVLSSSGSVSYTNNTGQNVRIIINAFTTSISGGASVSISAGGASFSATGIYGFGKNIAYSSGRTSSNNMSSVGADIALPTELMLSSGQSFSLGATSTLTGSSISGNYNIVIIPEAG